MKVFLKFQKLRVNTLRLLLSGLEKLKKTKSEKSTKASLSRRLKWNALKAFVVVLLAALLVSWLVQKKTQKLREWLQSALKSLFGQTPKK